MNLRAHPRHLRPVPPPPLAECSARKSAPILLLDDSAAVGLRHALDGVSCAWADALLMPPPDEPRAVVACLPAQPEQRSAMLHTLRRYRDRVPVVVLADGLVSQRAALLETVAHAVLPTDADPVEVVAQVLALCALHERPSSEVIAPEVIRVRSLEIDLERREVRAAGILLPLTPAEFRLLSLFARFPGRAVSHEQIARELRGYSGGERELRHALKVYIWRLRAKLADAVGEETSIATVRGYGYMLDRRVGSVRHRPTDE